MKKALLGGKAADDGVCALPCKQLFGLTCGTCTQGLGRAYPECLANDASEWAVCAMQPSAA